MKRSKIFLGITTAALALAGVAAAKHYGPVKTRFYITSGQQYCKAIPSLCTSGGDIHCRYTVGSGPFMRQFDVFTKGPEGPIATPAANCLSLILYTNELG